MPIDPKAKATVLDVAEQFVRDGFPVVIFPEGNSNTAPELRLGKTGAARLALRTGAPVIPVGIKGTSGIRPWQAFFWFFSLVKPFHVRIGEPISFPLTPADQQDEQLLRTTTDRMMQKISDVSGKPMPGMGPALGGRGFLWLFAWRLLRPLFQWRIRVKGKEYLPDHGPFIVVGDHASYFDAPGMAMAVFHATGFQPMFPTKQSVAMTFRRLMGQGGLNALGMLPLDNGDKSKVLEPAVHHLQHGGVIGIFPEGTRNKPKLNPKWETELLRGKTGVARLFLATNATVIPAAIEAPKGHGIAQSVLRALLPWHLTRVTFGPPVQLAQPTGEVTKETLDDITGQIMRAVARLSGKTYPY